jgi:hypothetical protein
MASTQGARVYRQAYHRSPACRRSMCPGGSQPGALFALLPGHFRALSPRLRCPAPGRIGCQVHASDRPVFERYCARMWIRGSGASVQALSCGRRGNAGRLATCAPSTPLLAADMWPVQGAAHASEQFVGGEWLYQIANPVGFDCLRPRPLVRKGGDENGGIPWLRAVPERRPSIPRGRATARRA